MTTDWRSFVAAYGRRAPVHHLAAVVGQPESAITKLRNSGVCAPAPRRTFGELFPLFHARQPREDEWPKPRRVHHKHAYEWLAPELALLASMVGKIGPSEIAETLTTRLRAVTGDPTARRSKTAVLLKQQHIGLQSRDVVGGVTIADAARQIGCRSILYNECRNGKLRFVKVGGLRVIPRDEFERWKATRQFAPAGYIRLASLKRPLGIKSDKLSEWARMGYVPSAIRANPYGTRERSTQFGTWFIDPKVAKKLVADRRAGRPMPWWRKPEPSNLKITWTLWQKRQHPASCRICADIWGPAGAPTTWDDYVQRYPPLAHGAKRHLTRLWTPGLRLDEVARHAGVSYTSVLRAVLNGALRAERRGRVYFVTKTDATRWKARKTPSGGSYRSWMAIATATKVYGFTRNELERHVADGRLRVKVGLRGAQRDVRYVLKQQVRELRDELGYSEREAARRVGVSIARLRVLLRGTQWRPAPRIPHEVVNTCIKRMESAEGVPVAEAARILGKSVGWVEREIANGTARVLRVAWNKHRRYISFPMFKRLCEAALKPTRRERWSSEWLLVSDASLLAGVCPTQVMRWANDGGVRFKVRGKYRRYHRRSVMARARQYWTTENRFKRATSPAWLQAERSTSQEPAA